MRWNFFLFLSASVLAAGLVTACGGDLHSRSEHSFDEIVTLVAGMSAAEITATLGEPDSRQPVFLRDERWIWWNYTFLAGEDYPPEARGQVVHLEITFRKPAADGGEAGPESSWRIAQPFGVAYRTPGEDAARSSPRSAASGPGRR